MPGCMAERMAGFPPGTFSIFMPCRAWFINCQRRHKNAFQCAWRKFKVNGNTEEELMKDDSQGSECSPAVPVVSAAAAVGEAWWRSSCEAAACLRGGCPWPPCQGSLRSGPSDSSWGWRRQATGPASSYLHNQAAFPSTGGPGKPGHTLASGPSSSRSQGLERVLTGGMDPGPDPGTAGGLRVPGPAGDEDRSYGGKTLLEQQGSIATQSNTVC